MKRFYPGPVQRLPLLLAFVLFVVHALLYFIALGYDAVDDAYISFIYARNAILGHGLVFNLSERVEGFTNFLWTGMMIPVAGAGLDVGRVSILLGILFAFGTLWLTTRQAHQAQLPRAAGWLAAFCLAVDGSFAIWAVSGLETAMFTFLITLGATLYLIEQRRAVRVPGSAIVFALAAMTRPEAAAVFALVLFHQFVWRTVRAGPNWSGNSTRRSQGSEKYPSLFFRLFPWTDISRGVTFAALFIPYWLLRWRYYHSFFPNSFYAKVAPGGPIAQIERGWHYVTQFVDVHLGWWIVLPALVALVVALAKYRKSAQDSSPLFALSFFVLLVLAYGTYIVYVGGDWSVGRFFVPILPSIYTMIAAGWVEVYQWLSNRAARQSTPAGVEISAKPMISRAVRNDRRPVYLGMGVAGIFLLALAFASSWNGEYGIFVRGFDAARATQAREAMGRWLKTNAPPGTWIAVDAAGQVPYFSELPAIDMFGINDWHIGRLSVATLGQGTPGHEKFDLAYILQRAPRYVIIYGTLFDNVTEYRRAEVEWTRDPELIKFLTIYERK